MTPEFIRPSIRQMHGYTPGEQPSAGARVIKLNTNENPFDPSPKVMQAIAHVPAGALRKYPDPAANAFRDAAAALHHLTRRHIMAGNGSDDILTIATRSAVPAGGILAYPDPTYSLYPVLAKLQDARMVAVPWGRDWSLPIDALVATKANAIYLANPNAPSGTFISPQKVSELAQRFSGMLLIDEAYVDFAPDNCVMLVKRFANIVVTRSLSKAYSLAGLRAGYAIAQPEIIDELMKAKDSYNCDALTIAAAAAALGDQAYVRGNWEKIKAERARVTKELTQLGCIVPPSEANFVLATVPGGRAKELYLALKQQGILVRFWDLPGLADKLRITIGQESENSALLAALKKMLAAAGKPA